MSGRLGVSDEFGDSREEAPASLRLGEERILSGLLRFGVGDSVNSVTGDGLNASWTNPFRPGLVRGFVRETSRGLVGA